MPKEIHGEKVDEAKWEKAKKLASEQGHSEEYDYIMGIYKKMVGMKAELKYGDVPDEQFDAVQLQAGVLVEREHTNDEGLAKQIAKAHLTEDPDYYRKLKQVEHEDIGRPVVGKTYFFSTDLIDYSIVEMKGEKSYFLTGYISTADVDLFNDLITENGLKSMLKQLTSKTIKLDYDHELWRENQSILPAGKIIEAKLDPKGLWVKAQLNDASPKFEHLWKSIKNGFVDAFSIAFIPKQTVMKNMNNGISIRLIDDLELLNVAITSAPVNPNAKMDKVFMKALTEINNREVILMAEEKKAAPPVPEKKAEEEPKKEEKKEEEEEEKKKKAEMKAEIDLKGMEDRIVSSVTEKIMKALDEKLVFKSIQQPMSLPKDEKVEEKGRDILDLASRR